MKNNIKKIVVLLYVLLLGLVYFHQTDFTIEKKAYEMVLIGILFFYVARTWIKIKKKVNADSALELFFVLFLYIWEISTSYLNLPNPILVPKPEEVIGSFLKQYKYLYECLLSSLQLIGIGYICAIPLGVVCGVFVGWKAQLRNVIVPIVKVFSSIPPIIYAPYLIAIAPSFRSASILLLTMTMFWPFFLNTVGRVENIDKEMLYSLEPLGLSSFAMVFYILVPYVAPRIVKSLKISFSSSFIMLIFAEMVGASAGLGYFIKLYSDYANYSNVVAGIILVIILVLLLNKLFDYLEQKYIRW